MRRNIAENRLVTLTGAGGVGKTRLAVQIAARLAPISATALWYVDLAPITDPDVVPVAVTRALGLPDQPGPFDDGHPRACHRRPPHAGRVGQLRAPDRRVRLAGG